MSATSRPMNITITHKSKPFTISLGAESTLSDLQSSIYEQTSIPPHLQKLIYRGKKATVEDDATLEAAGIREGMKIMLLGSTEEEVGGVKAAEDEKRKRDEIMKRRAVQGPTKLRSTSSSPASFSSLSSASFKFHAVQPLAHLPNPPTALALLNRLAEDPAIRHVMAKHEFSVGLLTELAPHEHPHLLGLNENRGQCIKLRIRTDAYDGFRLYKDVRRVLCHELTHNVWGDHDNNFKELNSQLNKEVAEFERARSAGTHTLGGEEYDPVLEDEAQGRLLSGSNVLGGGSDSLDGDSREERRRRVLEATLSRLKRQDEEIESRCGSSSQPPN